MKRNYVTPLIAVEHYNLTQSIAACVVKINSMSSDCVLNDSDSSWDMQDMAGFGYFVDLENCARVATNMDFEDGTCYHTSVQKAFTS